MAMAPARRRVRNGFAAACVLVIGMTGCGLRSQNQPTIRAGDIERALESATGIALKPVPPPLGTPSLPELVTTLSGATTDESLTVLVFFESDATKRALGTGGTPAGTDVLTRSNIVVLYRTSAGVADRSQLVRQALDAVIADA